MRILVTGATGFVGKHLVAELAKEHQVVAVTRRATPVPGAVDVLSVDSIDSRTNWSGLLRDVDVVLHLAARVHVMRETSGDPLEAFREVNTRGTRVLAEACAGQGVKRIIYMSSIKANGEATRGRPFTSADVPNPVDPYGRSKWEAELELAEVRRASELEVIILRPTVIYGQGVKGNIARIVKLVRSGVPLPFGAIRNKRTMLSVANLAVWVSSAISAEQAPSMPVLVGDPRPISTADLVSSLARGMGLRVPLLWVPVPLLRLGATILGKGSLAERLVGDLEVAPTFAALPVVEELLHEPEAEFLELGRHAVGESW